MINLINKNTKERNIKPKFEVNNEVTITYEIYPSMSGA
jgi:hypothetical protein